jgi:hypothetical protein
MDTEDNDFTPLDDTDDDLELEIVDDTPPEDRNRTPLPDEIKDQLDSEDEAEEYSEKVKQRIAQMKKAWHDERRAKEAALRERDEAARVAQMAYQERQQYQKYLEENENWALGHARERAKVMLESAKDRYKEAYDSGDSDAVLQAQEALQRAIMDFDKVTNYTPPKRQAPLQPQQNQVYQQPAPPKVDDKTKNWAQKNAWFGKDDEMTSFALGVHQRLVKEGVSPVSDEYFERLDARLREVFPQLKGAQQPQQRRQSVVAPVGRSPRSTKVTLSKSQVAVAHKLGITPEQYAKELMKLENVR